MAHNYKTLKAIENQEYKHGWFKVHCKTCKESRRVEPDGHFTCKCGNRINSPVFDLF